MQVSAERGKLGFMRSFTAAVCAALAGAFALSGPGEQAGGGRSPKGRAGPRPDEVHRHESPPRAFRYRKALGGLS